MIRVVLAELDSPGPLHYLIEGEGFQVVGCASNDVDLARVLAHTQPDVIVLDADISATSAPVARQKAPSSELIVLWPDGVQLPSGAGRVHPRLMYEDLGPVQRKRALERLAGRLVDGVLTVRASEERSQLRNREAALERMAEILAAAVAPPPPRRRPTRPSRRAVERRIAAKRRRSETKRLRRADDD